MGNRAHGKAKLVNEFDGGEKKGKRSVGRKFYYDLLQQTLQHEGKQIGSRT